jgi:hypothetical protein
MLERITPFLKALGFDESLDKMSPEKKAKLLEDLRKLPPVGPEGWSGKLPDFPAVERGPEVMPPPAVDPDAAPRGASNWLDQDRIKQFVEDWLDGIERDELANWLRESPAWRRALGELQQHLGKMNIQGPERWSFDLSFLERGIETVRSLPPPRLPSIRLPRIQLGPIGGPSLGGPGGGISATTLQTGAWVLMAIVVLAVLWHTLRSLKRGTAAPRLHRLGPWPVDPARVATRSELRAAFDYLALLTLGAEARTWNHRQIALAWGRDVASLPQTALAAESLAALYEQARYTLGEEALPPPEAAKAQADLLLLASRA